MKILTGAQTGSILKKSKISSKPGKRRAARLREKRESTRSARTLPARFLPFALIITTLISVLSPATLNAAPASPFSAGAPDRVTAPVVANTASAVAFSVLPVQKSSQPAPISRMRVRDILLLAAGRYNENLLPGDILKGSPGEGETHYLRAVTRLEAIIMISRAFGELPAPEGDLSRSGAPVPYYADVPYWAEQDVRNLANARILLPSDDKTLNGDDNLDESEFYLMVYRVYALLSSAPEDDFYHAINKSWLEKSVLRAGESSDSAFDELGYEVKRKVDILLDSILAGAWIKGSKEQKIADLYRCIVNMEGRNSAGIDPLIPYLAEIAFAKDLNALNDALYNISEVLGIDLFFGFTAETDIFNSSKHSIYFTHPAASLPKVFSADKNCPQTAAFLQYATTLFDLAGYNYPEKEAETVVDIDARLAKAARDPSRPLNYAEDYKTISMKRLETLFPASELKQLSNLLGFQPESVYYVRDIELLYAFAALYTEDNLEALKTYASFKLLDACSDMLSDAFADARYALSDAIMGQPQKPDPERKARDTVQSLTSVYLGEIYAEKYFSQAAKRDVEAIARIMIDVFKERIDMLDWMGSDTKTAAKTKLDELNVVVGIPQKWDSVMDAVNITGPSEGGAYFDNMTAYFKQSRALNAKKQGKAVSQESWDIDVFTVNAYYKPSANAIILPMSMLQAPFYVYGGKKETNFGGIGCIIGHEITHAIDYHGAQFNGSGSVETWWTERDAARFAALCERVATHYDGCEATAGISNDGAKTLFENIADLGMITCALSAVDTLPDPDYRLFFQNAAKIWANTSTRKTLEFNAMTDKHSPANVRVNKTFQNFKQFYDAFGIKRGDGMYIEPENRLKVW